MTAHTLERDGDLPLSFSGECIGTGGASGREGRRVVVRIYRTDGGNYLAHVDRFTVGPQGDLLDQGPRTCSPPTTDPMVMLAWLRSDNSYGTLGPASLDAWRDACEEWGGAAVEVVR